MKKKSTAKKVLLTILGVLLALVIVLVGTVYVIWHDEITTLLSFQQVTQRDESHKDGSVYVLNVSGGTAVMKDADGYRGISRNWIQGWGQGLALAFFAGVLNYDNVRSDGAL
mgnify:CR=1 FL=1